MQKCRGKLNKLPYASWSDTIIFTAIFRHSAFSLSAVFGWPALQNIRVTHCLKVSIVLESNNGMADTCCQLVNIGTEPCLCSQTYNYCTAFRKLQLPYAIAGIVTDTSRQRPTPYCLQQYWHTAYLASRSQYNYCQELKTALFRECFPVDWLPDMSRVPAEQLWTDIVTVL